MDRISPHSLRGAPRRAGPPHARGRGARGLRARDTRGLVLWSLGLLALWVLLPSLLGAQGFRSQVAWVTLTATKRAIVDSAGDVRRSVRGASVSDVEIPAPRPAATFDSAAAAEIRLEGTGGTGATLWMRGEENRLVAVSLQWMRLPISPWLRFRAVAPSGASLGAQRWLVRYRRVYADGTPVGRDGALVTVSTPASAER